MKLMTRNTDYAVRAVCYMAKKPQGVISVTELVKKLKIPRPFLRKILQMLTKSGLAKSYRGIGGGFALAVSPGEIFLADLMKVFQGQVSLNECIFKKKVCPHKKTCPLKRRIDAIELRAQEEIGSITILSLMEGV